MMLAGRGWDEWKKSGVALRCIFVGTCGLVSHRLRCLLHFSFQVAHEQFGKLLRSPGESNPPKGGFRVPQSSRGM